MVVFVPLKVERSWQESGQMLWLFESVAHSVFGVVRYSLCQITLASCPSSCSMSVHLCMCVFAFFAAVINGRGICVCVLVRDRGASRRPSSTTSATTRGGMNPSFLFLQVFESQVLRRKSCHEPDNSLISLPKNEVTSCVSAYCPLVN